MRNNLTITKVPRELFCFAPRPLSATLCPLDAAVLMVLRDQRGIFKTHGQYARFVFQGVYRHLPPLTPPERYDLTVQAVCGSLRRLARIGLAVRTASGEWRVAGRPL